jgi:redox-sensitive bicupin YhaK (pirin superfamily)
VVQLVLSHALMLARHLRLRSAAEIPKVDEAGSRCRRYLGRLGQRDWRVAREDGFGALRVFDDVVIEPRSQWVIDAHDGMDVVAYVLDGECSIEDDHGQSTDMRRDDAACAVLGHGKRHIIRNRSADVSLHVVILAIAAPVANPSPRIETRSFAHDSPGIVWFADHAVATPPSLSLGLPARMGLATFDPGVGLVFPKATERGIYVAVFHGQLEIDELVFVDAGGDARLSLDAEVRIQGASRTQIFVVDLPMGFAQELMGTTRAAHA